MNLALNYHHLRYFLAVAEHGGIQKAAQALHVSPPTLSAQVMELERFLEVRLFAREKRRLHLTDIGRVVRRYAERIFSLGDEMYEVVARGELGGPERVVVGVADSVPKLMVSRILSRALKKLKTLRVVVREGLPAELVPELVSHHLDLVISNEPAPVSLKTTLISTRLGSFGVRLMAAPSLRARFQAVTRAQSVSGSGSNQRITSSSRVGALVEGGWSSTRRDWGVRRLGHDVRVGCRRERGGSGFRFRRGKSHPIVWS